MKEKTRQKRFFILAGFFIMLFAVGWGAKPYTGKAYDGTFYAAGKTFYIRRNASGSGKKVIKTIRTSKNNRLTYVGNLTKHSATCYIIGNQWVTKTVRW